MKWWAWLLMDSGRKAKYSSMSFGSGILNLVPASSSKAPTQNKWERIIDQVAHSSIVRTINAVGDSLNPFINTSLYADRASRAFRSGDIMWGLNNSAGVVWSRGVVLKGTQILASSPGEIAWGYGELSTR